VTNHVRHRLEDVGVCRCTIEVDEPCDSTHQLSIPEFTCVNAQRVLAPVTPTGATRDRINTGERRCKFSFHPQTADGIRVALLWSMAESIPPSGDESEPKGRPREWPQEKPPVPEEKPRPQSESDFLDEYDPNATKH
jgi:hypothetical protein